MKSLFTIIIVALLLTTVSCSESILTHPSYEITEHASENNSEDLQNVMKAPPSLTVFYGEKSITALKGTSSWNYDNGDGTFASIESDSMHPLQAKEYMTPLVLMPSIYSHVDPHTAYLLWEHAPDTVSVKCWDESCWNKFDSEFTEIYVEVPDTDLQADDKYFTFNVQDGNYIYEVIASWESNEKCGGTAHYSFYTSKPNLMKDAIPIPEDDSICGYPLNNE